MINQILLIFTVVLIYEFLKFVRIIHIVKSNLYIYIKILKLFRFVNASDFRKEKLIFYYSKSLIQTSFKILGIFTCVILFLSILSLLFKSYLNFIISIFGMLELSLIFLIYHLIRRKIYE